MTGPPKRCPILVHCKEQEASPRLSSTAGFHQTSTQLSSSLHKNENKSVPPRLRLTSCTWKYWRSFRRLIIRFFLDWFFRVCGTIPATSTYVRIRLGLWASSPSWMPCAYHYVPSWPRCRRRWKTSFEVNFPQCTLPSPKTKHRLEPLPK